MKETSNYLLAAMHQDDGNGGMSFLTIAIMVLAYLSITAIVLRTFQYVKERDIKKYR